MGGVMINNGTKERPANTPGDSVIYIEEDSPLNAEPRAEKVYVHFRDIYNLAASRIMTSQRWTQDPIHGWRDWVVPLWMDWARDTRYPKIRFDALILYPSYRRKVEELLGIETDDSILEVQSGPSGFGEARRGQKRDPKTSLNRWREVSVDLPEEVHEMNYKIFGWRIVDGKMMGTPHDNL